MQDFTQFDKYAIIAMLIITCLTITVASIVIFIQIRRKNMLHHNLSLNVEIGGALREAILVDDYLNRVEMQNRLLRHSTMIKINQLCGAMTHNIMQSSSLRYDMHRLSEYRFKTLSYTQHKDLFKALVTADNIFYNYISKKYFFFKFQLWLYNRRNKKKQRANLKLIFLMRDEI